MPGASVPVWGAGKLDTGLMLSVLAFYNHVRYILLIVAKLFKEETKTRKYHCVGPNLGILKKNYLKSRINGPTVRARLVQGQGQGAKRLLTALRCGYRESFGGRPLLLSEACY